MSERRKAYRGSRGSAANKRRYERTLKRLEYERSELIAVAAACGNFLNSDFANVYPSVKDRCHAVYDSVMDALDGTMRARKMVKAAMAKDLRPDELSVTTDDMFEDRCVENDDPTKGEEA